MRVLSVLVALACAVVAQGFLAPMRLPTAAPANVAGPRMFFGGGGGQKKSGKGIDITVKQKTGFKDTVISLDGPKNLRKALLDKKVDLYPLQGKIYNCGGGGSCGTCAVNIVAGAGNASPKGPAEKKLLAGKPDSYRLSCCTMAKGPMTVMVKP